MFAYRNLASDCMGHFEIEFRETRLRVSFSEHYQSDFLKEQTKNCLSKIYNDLDHYILIHPDYITTLTPWEKETDKPVIQRMIEASVKAGVGPMASVAGAVAESLLSELSRERGKLIIENGGDIALISDQETIISIYPGWGKFDADVFLKIPSGRFGVASSSGKYGHSFSYGKADLVTVVDKDPILADAWATAIGNRIFSKEDAMVIAEDTDSLFSVTIIVDEELIHKGNTELLF
ncbi:MAG: UPF0280 family protein [Acidobacteria bacterium]|nr:UPF0280 family protein [Acidobacteriota bacterium]